MPSPLLSRTLDPVLGVFTGIFAFYLYEKNPRTARADDQRLQELIRWKWAKWQNEREAGQFGEESSH